MGIRLKLFLPIILSFGLIVSVVHFHWLPILLEHERSTIIERESDVLRAIGPGLILPIFIGDLGTIYATLNHQIEINTDGWKRLVLENSEGKRLYPLTLAPITNDGLLYVEREIKWEGRTVAILRLHVDWQEKRLLQMQRIHQMELQAITIFIIVMVITGIWQNRWIRTPLVRLARAADHLAKGDYEAQLPAESQDELGRLTHAFGQMRADLKNTSQYLYQAILKANKSESRQRMLLETMVDGFVTTNERGVIESFNSAAEKIFGYQADEVLGHNVSMLMPKSEAKDHDLHLMRYLKTGNANVIGIGREIEGQHKDGSAFPIEIALSDTEIDGTRIFTAIMRDITTRVASRKQLQEQKRHLNTILQNTRDAYLTVDKDWQITFANKISVSLLNIKPDEIIGTDLRETLPDVVNVFYKMLHCTFVEKISQERVVLYGPTMKYLQAYSYPTKEGLIVHFHDITLSKKFEDELRHAKEAAEHANQAKSDFIARMSHELRTPMNAILGFGQLLEMDEEIPAEQKTQVSEIVKAGDHLLELINEVLDLAMVEKGGISILDERVVCSELIHESLNLIAPLAEQRGIELHYDDAEHRDVVVRGDHTRLKEIMLNLLSNAVKYNREQGKVTLNCEPVTGNRIRISVSDTGPGLNEEQLRRLFEPFERLGAEYSDIEGTGIGLTISKRIVELMDGTIGVKSVPAEGSTFWIELQHAPEMEQTVPEELLKSAAVVETEFTENKKPTVLYIEDSPTNLRLMEHVFKRRPDITLLSVMTPERGLELAAAHQPELILLDIHLPGMDGYEVMQRLQASDETKHIPIVAISAAAMPEDIKKGMDAGFLRYITKPIKVDEVMSTIDMVTTIVTQHEDTGT